MTRISYILVNYRTPAMTCRCLEGLYRHARMDDAEVIVVDNGAAAGPESNAEAIAKAFPQATVIPSEENLGFGRACNLAASRAKGTYLYFVNTDLEFREDAGSGLADFLDRMPDAWGAGNRVLNGDGSWQPTAAHFPTLVRILAGRRVLADLLRPLLPGPARRLEMFLPEEDLTAPRRVDWCTGASLMFRADAFARLRGFDPAIFLYAEELELQKRARDMGGEVWFTPQPTVIHHEAGSSGGHLSPDRLAFIAAGHRYYYRKHHGQFLGTLMGAAEFAATLAKASVWSLAGLFSSKPLVREKGRWHRVAVRAFYARRYGPDTRSRLACYLTWGMVQPDDGSLSSRIRSITGVTSIHTRIRGWHMLRLLESRPLPGQVLELGFGEGDLLLNLARRHPDTNFEGWEIDGELVRRASAKADKLGLRNLRFLKRDFAESPPEQRFGLIFCADVLEHIPDDAGLVRHFRDCLEPGGRLVVHVPYRGADQRRFLPWFRSHTDPGHLRPEYTDSELAALLEGGGFRDVRIGRTFGPFGEAAFELNSLAWKNRRLDRVLRLLTLPVALPLGALDAAFPPRRGNSLLAECEREAS